MSEDVFISLPTSSATTTLPVELSPIDQLTAHMISRRFWFFEISLPSHNQPNRAIFLHFQSGLSRALMDLPGFAAEIVRDPCTGRAAMVMPEKPGVKMCFRDYTSDELHSQLNPYSYESLKAGYFSPSALRLISDKLTSVSSVCGERNNVVDVQLNFIENGMIMAVCFHHAYTGGAGHQLFMDRWSYYTAAAAKGIQVTPYPSLTPDASNRGILHQGSAMAKLSDYLVLKEKSHSNVTESTPSVIPTSTAIWRLSSTNASKLKKSLISLANTNLSLNDCVSALVWRHMSRARNLDASRHPVSKWCNTVDFKHIVRPGLPEDYIGNAATSTLATIPTATLVKTDMEGLAAVAVAVRESINAVTAEIVAQTISTLSETENPSEATTWSYRPDVCDGGMTSWARFKFVGLDWGPGIRMAAVRYISRPGYQGVGVLTRPVEDEGGLDIMMSMTHDAIDRMKRDDDWLEWVRFMCV